MEEKRRMKKGIQKENVYIIEKISANKETNVDSCTQKTKKENQKNQSVCISHEENATLEKDANLNIENKKTKQKIKKKK